MALLTRRRRGQGPAARREGPRPLALRDEIDRLFDDFFSGWPTARGLSATGEFIPSVDMSETDNEVKITAELPGMTEDDVDVELDEDMLTIRGEKKQEEEEEGGGRYWCESSYGKFVREVPLPSAVDPDKADASFKNGQLKVTVPKRAEEQSKRRKIEVKSG